MSTDAPLEDNIEIEEGRETVNGRHVVYDDANAQYIIRGTHVVGNPTIGYGRLITSGNGLSEDEALMLLTNDIAAVQGQLASVPGFSHLSQPIQDAVADMDFNLGFATLMTFRNFFGFLMRGENIGAANDLRGTAWYRQVGARGERIARIIETGTWIPA